MILTVSCVEVAAVTVPIAPLLNTTVLFVPTGTVGSKFVPLMMSVVAFCARFAELSVTVGGGARSVTVGSAVPGKFGSSVNTFVKLLPLTVAWLLVCVVVVGVIGFSTVNV